MEINTKISIVTAYYNRKQQFIETLKSISKSNHTNFEMIVVDDCSDEDQRIEDLIKDFQFIKIIRLEKENKQYVNPCIPFNIGIKAISKDTDIVVLQNPECLHVSDILSYFKNNINNYNYISIAMYFLDDELTEVLPFYYQNNIVFDLLRSLPLDNWRNHPTLQPSFYHFCSAMSKTNMDKLKGFDERYSQGIALDDCDFVNSIRKLGLKMIIPDPDIEQMAIIHQYHPTVFYNNPEYERLFKINKDIYHSKGL